MPHRIELCRQALSLVERYRSPQQWASWHRKLADSLWQNPLGSRADDLEEAIFHYEQALEVYTRQATPSDWAMTQSNLANAFKNRIRGERGKNLEQAIDYYKQGLKVHTRQAYPDEWAMTQHNLATAYQDRIRGERGENLEQAIDHYKQALEVHTRQATPSKWAMTQNNLAALYRNRIKGERGDNLEQAIFHAEQALEVRTRQAYPEYWADTQNNLANAYLDRIRGERGDNLEQAILHARQALEVRTRQAFPEKWAETQNNLANAYLYRIKGERRDNLEQAIHHYRQALEVRTRQAYPEKWAATQNNLALAYSDRIKGERRDNLEQAIYHYEQALEVYTRQAYPEKWAVIQNNLAGAHKDRSRFKRGDMSRAIFHYRQALDVYTPQSFPQDCRDTAYRLGDLLYDEGRLGEAREAFTIAHQAVEALRGEIVREATKRELAEENADLYARLVYCCLHDGDEAAAFEYTVAGKGRVFVDLLVSASFDFASLGAQVPGLAADWAIVRQLRQKIDSLQVKLSGMQAPSEESKRLYRQLRAEQEALGKHWQEMNWNYPVLSATSSAPTLSSKQACQLARELNGTLVEYVRHAEGWGAFVVSANKLRYVRLPLVDDALLDKMENWVKRLDGRAGRGKFSYRPLPAWHEALIAPLSLPLERGESRSAVPLPTSVPERVCGTVLVVAPFGRLHLLPLAALRAGENEPYLAAQYKLSFVPTLGALRVLRDQERKDEASRRDLRAQRLLSVAYPGTPPLSNVLPESEAIMKHFEPHAIGLHNEKATPDAVLEAAPGKQIVHFGCHGWFDSEHPGESGLMLAGGWLTVQRIIAELNLKESRLATLAACESGKSHVRSGDEHVGLMQAIMTAGAKSVVASLWNVNDAATRAIFEAFYAQAQQGHAPALALQNAQQALRQRAHWRHPYYWAAFTISGLAHHSTLVPVEGRQTVPEPVEGPINLSKHLDELNQMSQKGRQSMNAEQMKGEAHAILEQLIEYPSEIQADLDPSEAAVLLDGLNALAEQARHAENEADLLALTDAIQTLAEDLPSVRDLLLEEHSDIAKLQQQRKITLQNHQKTAKGDKEAQKALPIIQNELVQAHDALAKHLPDTQTPAEPPTWRDNLWRKLGLE